MKNAEIVRALPKLKSLKDEEKWTRDQIQRLQKQSLQLQHEISTLERVDSVIDGIAVSETDLKGDRSGNIYGKMYRIGAVDYSIERSAEVYPNAHTSEKGVAKDWGLKIYAGHGISNEEFYGTGWPFKDAVEIARRWVTKGDKPTKTQEEMLKVRHKHDPEGRATKKRRDAFEAAWLANHKDLAVEILTGRAKLSTNRGSREQQEAV